MWNKKCETIFTQLTEKLNAENIRYFVLRNYKDLPEVNESKDVDIVVDPKLHKRASAIIRQIYKDNGIEFYEEAKIGYTLCTHGMSIENKTGIHIDLIKGLNTKGYEIVDFNEVYSHTKEYKGFFVLEETWDAAILLAHKTFGYKKPVLKDKYINIIEEQMSNDKEAFGEVITHIYGTKKGQEIIDKIEKDDFDAILTRTNQYDSAIKRRVSREKFLKTIWRRTFFAGQKFNRIVLFYRKYKRVFAVLAPDGAGKTTFLDSLIEKLNYYYVNDLKDGKFHIYHFRPSILPNLGEVGEKAGVMEQDKDFTNPHRNKPANPISSFFRIAYYTLDYIIGWQKFIRDDVRRDRYSVFDRYSYDLIVDPQRTRLRLPRFIRRFFVWLTPRPGVVFILTADADVIYQRKQELTKEEIKRQLIEYDKLSKKSKRFKVIDAEQSPGEMSDIALKLIMEKFAK